MEIQRAGILIEIGIADSDIRNAEIYFALRRRIVRIDHNDERRAAIDGIERWAWSSARAREIIGDTVNGNLGSDDRLIERSVIDRNIRKISARDLFCFCSVQSVEAERSADKIIDRIELCDDDLRSRLRIIICRIELQRHRCAAG